MPRLDAARVRALLDESTPGPWTYELGTSICSGYEYKNHRHTAVWIAEIDHDNQEDLVNEGCGAYSPTAQANANLIALLPELAAAYLAQDAELLALRAEVAQLRAGAVAVEELALEWMREADDIRAQNDRSWDDAASGVEGTLDRCASQLALALADASPPGAGAGGRG